MEEWYEKQRVLGYRVEWRVSLNGVIRPAYRIHQAYMYRCGMRYGYTSRNTVWNGYIGFRSGEWCRER